MNSRQSCALVGLVFVIIYSCADRLLAKTEQEWQIRWDLNAETSYPWTSLKTSAEADISNARVQNAESKVIQALQTAERELSKNCSVDSDKAASLDQLVADSEALQNIYDRELDEVYKSHRSDANCKPLVASVLKKSLALSFLNLSVMRKYRTPGDSKLRAREAVNSKLQAAL